MRSLSSQQACQLSCEETARFLDVNVSQGLNVAEVAHRKAVHGSNDFEINEDTPLWKKYMEQVGGKSLLFIM